MRRRIKRMGFSLAMKILLFALIVNTILETKAQQNLNRIITCFGRCGEDAVVPCSCHPKCFVMKNCCEYISAACPFTLTKALQLYGDLVNANIECKSGYQMISSCPAKFKKRSAKLEVELNTQMYDSCETADCDEKRSTPTTLTNSSTANNRQQALTRVKREGLQISASPGEMNDVNNSKILEDLQILSSPGEMSDVKNSKILEAVGNAPVWESSTGFLYVNATIFYCRGRQKAHLVPWRTQFALASKDNITSLTDFEKHTGKYSYKPPDFLEKSQAGYPCYGTLDSTCDTFFVNRDTFICSSFTSFVTSNRKIYRNRFCFYCNTPRDTDFTPVLSVLYPSDISTSLFSLTMSLNSEGGLSMYIKDEKKKGPIAWVESSCKLNLELDTEEGSRMEDYQGQCKVKVCDTMFQLRPDGRCKTLHNTYIAIDEANYPLTSLEEDGQASQFLSCGLNKYLDMEVSQVNEPLMVKTYLNKTMLIANISTFQPKLSSMSSSRLEFLNGMEELMTLLQALREFRKKEEESVCRFGFDRKTNLPANGSINVTTIDSGQFQFVGFENVSDYRASDKGMTDGDDIILCLTSSPVSSGSNQIEELACIEEALYQRGVDKVIEFCNSTCFSSLEGNNSKSWGDNLLDKDELNLVSFNLGQNLIFSMPLRFVIVASMAVTTFLYMEPV